MHVAGALFLLRQSLRSLVGLAMPGRGWPAISLGYEKSIYSDSSRRHCDGVQHAKIKNMYMRDIRGFADLDVKLTPYVACTSDISGRGATPAIGMSLNISF